MSNPFYREAVENAIRRQTGCEAVEFEEDSEHVLVLVSEPERAWVRYRLGSFTQHYLAGEFPDDTGVGENLELLRPKPADDDEDDEDLVSTPR
jgi:hypothetical protein